MRRKGRGPAWLTILLMTPSLRAGETSLTVADLAAYRAALADSGARQGPPSIVGFRDLWDHPKTYEGRRVQVQGRLVRRFRQGSLGTFPPLEEGWLFSPAGNPFCVVFPAAAAAPAGPAQVRFTGTFLKLVEYQGGDGPRRAPLIVGPAPPVPLLPKPGQTQVEVWASPWRHVDVAIALAAAVLVALVLALQHLRRPLRRHVRITPAPLFDDAPSASVANSGRPGPD